MECETKERWMQLAEQATKEQDPEKLLQLIEEINVLLAAKQERLDRQEQLKQGRDSAGPAP
jgi:hypothetical protein